MKVPPDRTEVADPRGLAFRILRRVEEAGSWALPLLERYESELADPREARLLHELVLGVLRRRRVLDHVVRRTASRTFEEIDPSVRTALRLGAYPILFLDRVPDHAAVDTAVAVLRRAGHARAAGFVNAVLRRVARERQALLPPEPARGDVSSLALSGSHPEWWTRRLVARSGWEDASALIAADNRPAATVLRPNLRRTTPGELARMLEREGVHVESGAFLPDALRVVSGLPRRTRALREGYAFVQDEAAQLVPRMLGRLPGRKVADLCAAPGGKTLHLAEGVPVGERVIAVDRHPGRLRRMARSLSRLGTDNVDLIAADVASRPAPLPDGQFDSVLVDAPCTGTGTFRRHPEIRWRLSPGDPARLAERQGQILAHAARLLRPGGRLLYSVCSLEPEEGDEVVQRFLDRHPAFGIAEVRPALPPAARRLVGPDGALRTSPADGEVDGFYAVVMVLAPAISGR